MPPTGFSCDIPRDDAELQRVADLIAQAFFIPPERCAAYVKQVGKETLRAARLETDICGGLVLLPMGQFWGGRSVPMTGFAAVVVSPEHRSRGVGVQMMTAALRELHDHHIPLATLYPATVPLYRKVGFEIAGSNAGIKIPLAAIDLREDIVTVRPARDDDRPTLRSLYKRYAAEHNGMLDRSDTLWKRVEDFRGLKRLGYLLEHAGAPEGYFFIGQDHTKEGKRYLDIGDLVVTSPAAARRFWQFLADHRSMVEFATMLGPPNDPLLWMLREPTRTLVDMPNWMLRIVRVADALEKRGYTPGLSTEIHLRVHDELLPQNTGDYLLRVDDGRASVSPGGRGSIQLSINGLAALYSGAARVADLAAIGLLHGPEEELAPAEALFAGPAPWMRDAF
jgi:predicted acetyltransferase